MILIFNYYFCCTPVQRPFKLLGLLLFVSMQRDTKSFHDCCARTTRERSVWHRRPSTCCNLSTWPSTHRNWVWFCVHSLSASFCLLTAISIVDIMQNTFVLLCWWRKNTKPKATRAVGPGRITMALPPTTLYSNFQLADRFTITKILFPHFFTLKTNGGQISFAAFSFTPTIRFVAFGIFVVACSPCTVLRITISRSTSR